MTLDHTDALTQGRSEDLVARLAEDLAALRAEHARLSAELEIQKAEVGAQKARWAAMAGLPPADDASGRQPPERDEEADAAVSRRGLLRRLGAVTAAGAGMAVGTSLLGASPAAAGTDGDVRLGYPNHSAIATTGLTSIGPAPTLEVSNDYEPFTTPNLQAKAVVARLTSGHNPSAALHGHTEGRGAGVLGTAPQGVGLQGEGGRAPLFLVPSETAGPPTSGNHALGEVVVDSSGAHYICALAGTPGRWRKVTAGAPAYAEASGSVNFLPSPIRLFDSRGGAPLAAGTSRVVQITGVGVRGVPVPVGAVGVIGNVTVTETQAPSGYLALYPEGSPAPGTSNINWFAANQNLSTAAIVGLNPANGRMTIHNGALGGSNATHVVFDAAGFVF